MATIKITDWRGWFEGMRSKMMKAGAESLAANLTAMLGTNGIASMVPSMHEYVLGWKTAIVTTVAQFVVRVVLAGATYVASKPDPDVITETVDTTVVTKDSVIQRSSTTTTPVATTDSKTP